MIRIHFKTYGCQMNKVDAQLVAGQLRARFNDACEFTDNEADADIILFETCSVRAQAENRVWSNLGRLRAVKAAKPSLLICVIGCMAQKEADAIRRRAPHVDLVVGTQRLDRIPDYIDSLLNGGPPVVDTSGEGTVERLYDARPQRDEKFAAWLPVSRGCDKRCTYCVVPGTRGPEVSTPVDALISRARQLADDGAVCLTLLAQTIDTYGQDLNDPNQTLAVLLRRLHAELPALERINFVTSYPSTASESIFEAVRDCPRVSRYLHLPVQSGSDGVLKRMKRGYTLARYEAVVDAARKTVPGIEIATDVIVGFPGESDADFEETYKLIERTRFCGAFIFRYSPRDGTPAARLADDVPDGVKRERQQALLKLQEAISIEMNAALTGQVARVFVEGLSDRDSSRWAGRTDTQRIVVFPAAENESLAGQFVDVLVESSTALTLAGRRIEKTVPARG